MKLTARLLIFLMVTGAIISIFPVNAGGAFGAFHVGGNSNMQMQQFVGEDATSRNDVDFYDDIAAGDGGGGEKRK